MDSPTREQVAGKAWLWVGDVVAAAADEGYEIADHEALAWSERITDAVMALLTDTPQEGVSSLHLSDGNGTVYLAEQVGWQKTNGRFFRIHPDPVTHARETEDPDWNPVYRLSVGVPAPPEAPQPQVLPGVVLGPCGDLAQVPVVTTRAVDTEDGRRVEIALTSDPYGWRVRSWFTPEQARQISDDIRVVTEEEAGDG